MQSPKNTLTALLATAALLVAPSAAIAQNAGDQQYADPLADTPSQEGSGGGGNSGSQDDSGSQGNSGSGSGSQDGTTGSDAPSTQGQSSQATPSQGSTDQSSGQALPRTGSDSALLLAAGAVLLGSGLLLRLGVTARRTT